MGSRDRSFPIGMGRSLPKLEEASSAPASDEKAINVGVPTAENLGETVGIVLVPEEQPINANAPKLPPEQEAAPASPETQPPAVAQQPPAAEGDIRHAA